MVAGLRAGAAPRGAGVAAQPAGRPKEPFPLFSSPMNVNQCRAQTATRTGRYACSIVVEGMAVESGCLVSSAFASPGTRTVGGAANDLSRCIHMFSSSLVSTRRVGLIQGTGSTSAMLRSRLLRPPVRRDTLSVFLYSLLFCWKMDAEIKRVKFMN